MLRKNFWYNMQIAYLQVCRDSAFILHQKSLIEKKKYTNEDDISRDFYFAIEEVVYSSNYIKQKLNLPTFQANSQPLAIDKIKVKREDKRPDFMWSYFDYVNRQRLDFHIECKRLRRDKNHHCKEYVYNGVNRYLDKEWSYGLHCEMGLMIGYVEELIIEDCVAQIENNLKKLSLPTLQKLTVEDYDAEIVFLHHKVDRVDIPKSPFELHHYLIKIISDNSEGQA